MKIIEFLMNNIFIVVVIVGALASLFRKSGSKNKPGRMPDFGGGGLPRTLYPQDSRKELEERPIPAGSVGETLYRSQTENKREDREIPSLASRESEMSVESPQIASLQRVLQSAATNKDKVSGPAERKSVSQGAVMYPNRAEDLRRAVIWAEILGPPRSKKPFRK
ncbi:hypothetical protein [Paenibacillus sp. LHD-38]|uniref:hypothetical protein n=1 Tax=Paenibacillus sp. LHD-38 TaxID=3072143 RepID=UPI00280C7F6E|nr:hypothetical protein [Paenibacillus sp. LHD-38]MDQ8736710.1 hypothetical protein [Paenibacillus sp. LHD-38]